MSNNGESKNPIVDRGLMVSPAEYDLVSAVLTECAKESEKRGHPEVRKRLMGFVGRMKHAVQAGQGLTKEQAERYQTELHEAFRTRDQYKLGEVVENLIATTLRLEPDPAGTVAGYLMQMLGQIVAGHERASVMVLGQLDAMLDEASKDWSASKWPKAEAVMAWIQGTIAAAVDNMKLGRDPWPED